MTDILNKETEKKIEEKKCKGLCGRTLPLDSFRVCKLTKDGREGKCLECKNAEARSAYAKKKKNASELPVQKTRRQVVEPLPPVTPARIPDYLIPKNRIVELDDAVMNDDFKTISVNFSNYPDMFDAVKELAKNEFRSPNQQILYMLKKQIGLPRFEKDHQQGFIR